MALKIGTRGSRLALEQTRSFVKRIGDCNSEVVVVETLGDKLKNKSLASVGGKGLFLKELEESLLKGEIDVAVHSLKDVPAFFDERLAICCFLPRLDPRDAFISNFHKNIFDVPRGSEIATSSVRRKYQLESLGLKDVPLRGNVITRLSKLNQFDGMILAVAGLVRLGLENFITNIISEDVFLPAVGQGIICVQSRKDDSRILSLIAKANDHKAEICANAERQIIKALEGDCLTPIGGLAILCGDGSIKVAGMIVKDGKIYRDSEIGPESEAAKIGRRIGNRLLRM